MILLMEEISEIKGYRELTFHLSVNIVDMYLAKLAKNGKSVPKIVTLGTVSILLAAKLNESCSPNFTNMVYLINARNPGELVLSDLIELERQILTTLDFNLQSETSINFLERFCQLYRFDEGLYRGSDMTVKAKFSKDVCAMGRYLCRCALKFSTFLDFKPSQVAAACFILALNTVSHKSGLKLGVLS